MASVASRAGLLYFDFRYRGQRCREYTKLPDNTANRRRMEAALERLTADIEAGSFSYASYFPNSAMAVRFASAEPRQPSYASASKAAEPPDSPMFRAFAKVWLGEKAVEWRRSYKESVDSIFTTHLLPAFGDEPIGAITREKILAFRVDLASKKVRQNGTEREKTLSAATVNRIMGILRMLFDESVERHKIVSPFTKIKRLRQPKTDIHPFTLEEVRRIIATVREDFRNYLTFRFFTGVRSGEANGLKWKYIDWDRRQILIRETFSHGRTEYTKTDGSQREIDMSQMVYDALKAQYRETGKRSEYVFCNANGAPLDNKNFDSRVWRPLLRFLGVEVRRPYQMRHTCATLWLAAGENPQWIARQMGHSTTEMLFRVYARFVPNLTRKDGSAFDRLLNSAMAGGVEQTHEGADHA